MRKKVSFSRRSSQNGGLYYHDMLLLLGEKTKNLLHKMLHHYWMLFPLYRCFSCLSFCYYPNKLLPGVFYFFLKKGHPFNTQRGALYKFIILYFDIIDEHT